jgi:hypothetical protein
VHSERFKHIGRSLEANGLALLPNGKSGEIDGNDPVLPKRQAVVGVTRDLKNELTVPAFIKELSGGRSPKGQAAENERARAETEQLVPLAPFQSDEFDPLSLAQFVFGDD